MTRPHGLARLSLALALLAAPPAAAFEYRTDAHALIANLPDSWHICMNESPAPNHGFWVLMEQGDCDRDDPIAKSASPMVVFSISYNVVREYRTAADMQADICGRVPALRARLRVAGARLMVCPMPPKDGFERATYFGVRPRTGQHISSWTEITITASCPTATMPRCRKVAAEIATRMRDWPQDQ